MHYFLLYSKVKAELPDDPEILLLGIYLEKTVIRKDRCGPVFTAALFTIARTWKQPRCPWTGEWIKTTWCTCSGILLSHKKNETGPLAATGIGLEIIILRGFLNH